jgi:hypothetical protein
MLGLLAAGCGQEAEPPEPRASLPQHIGGSEVAAMAERELESENPAIEPGTMRCPTLDLAVGASVRCLRTVRLTEGRIVRIGGTVTVTSLASGGRLHVTLDDHPDEFGVDGDHLAADVRKRYLARVHRRATVVRCPYLPGRVGATVTCRLKVGGAGRDVRVTVTAVDPEDYRTTYTIDPGDSVDSVDPAS